MRAMTKYSITFEDAKTLCEYYNNQNFYSKVHEVDGFKCVSFNYFLCGYEHFANPIPGKPMDAFDMRGVTFVTYPRGDLFRRFLMLPKFFNLNQVPSTQYSVVSSKTIRHVAEKADGSLIAFMMLPSGKVFAKTIDGFNNEQVEMAMKIAKGSLSLFNWIHRVTDEGFTPLFEYVSRHNRIVVRYDNSELRLIGLRNNMTREFIPGSEVENLPHCIVVIKNEKLTLDEMISMSKTVENKEGWVVMFDDGTFVKIKTSWYFNLHGLMTENLFREDYIAHHYLSGTLDDIVCQIEENDTKAHEFIGTVVSSIDKFSSFIDGNVNELIRVLNEDYKGDFNKFATNNHKRPYFSFVSRALTSNEEYKKHKVRLILKETYRLNEARTIVDKYKN